MGLTKSYERKKGQVSTQMMWGRLKNVLVFRYLRRYSFSESSTLVIWVESSKVGVLVPLLPRAATQCVLGEMYHFLPNWGSFSHDYVLFLAGHQEETLFLRSHSPCTSLLFWWGQYRLTSLQVPHHLPHTHTHTHIRMETPWQHRVDEIRHRVLFSTVFQLPEQSLKYHTYSKKKLLNK